MAKPLTATKNTAQQNLNNSNTAQLSVRMSVQFLKEHLDDEFVHLFSHSDETAQHLADSFIENGYDESQPVHLAYIEDEDTEVVIDGMTRLHALELANFFDVPVYKHTFKTRLDALMHAYRLQLDRRNLNDAQKIAAVEKMMLLKNPSTSGKTAAAIAEQLGMSTRNVEKTINIIKNGDEETKNAVLNAQMSINAADKKVHNAKKAAQSDDDDISDALEDNSDQPKGLVISDHSDHIERPTNKLSPEEDSERTRERRKAYEIGFTEGFVAASLFSIGKFLKYDAAYVYDCVFCRQTVNFPFLINLLRTVRTPQELAEIHNLRLKIKEMGMRDFNPHPLDVPAAVETENGEQALDFGESENSADEKPDTAAETNASDSDDAFDIEFEEK